MELPDYVLNELRLRLRRNCENPDQVDVMSQHQIEILAERLGVDLEASLSPPPPLDAGLAEQLAGIRGGKLDAVEFDLTVAALGTRKTNRVRLPFAMAERIDDETDPLSEVESIGGFQVLLWEERDATAEAGLRRASHPTWRDLFIPLEFFPAAFIERLHELVQHRVEASVEEPIDDET
jgi:hypothetical protein